MSYSPFNLIICISNACLANVFCSWHKGSERLEDYIVQGTKRAKDTIHPKKKPRTNFIWFGEQFRSCRFDSDRSLLSKCYTSSPPNVDAMVGQLIILAQMLVKEVTVAFLHDDDEINEQKPLSSKFQCEL